MEINQPAKFGGHRHYCRGNITFLVDEGKNYTCSQLNPLLFFFSKPYGMSRSHLRNFLIKITLTKRIASVSHYSSPILFTPSCVTNDEIYPKKLFPIRQKKKTATEKKKRKKKGKRQMKAFCFTRQDNNTCIRYEIRHQGS